MKPPFDDIHPRGPRILFVGLPHSTHTHGWIRLLDGEPFNVRLFTSSADQPPDDWDVPTYITAPGTALRKPGRRYIDPPPGRLRREENARRARLPFRASLFAARWLNAVGRAFAVPELRHVELAPKARLPAQWLATVIQRWQPDIVHTLGLFDRQGGELYLEARRHPGVQGIGRWVLQLRGGSDTALRRHDPLCAEALRCALETSDHILLDNVDNVDYVTALGFGHKIPSIAPVPGGGGIHIPVAGVLSPPSGRERLILWPKAGESRWAKALPVLEALREAWPRLQPARVLVIAAGAETRAWIDMLPVQIRSCVDVCSKRLPQPEFLALLARARVMLAPSLVDGVPNVLYEAMACGTVPIVSPLATLTPLLHADRNVLFARNLHPSEIGDALDRALNDDALADRIADANLPRVAELADRDVIARRVAGFYRSLVAEPGAAP